MRTLIAVAAALLVPATASAWGLNGHRVVAEIAQRHLSPEAARAVARILHGRALADVANWADELRDDPRYDKYKPLHFATVDGVAHYADAKKAPCGDLVVAIHVLGDFLKTGKRDGLNAIKSLTQTPDADCNPVITDAVDERIALALLVHFVGDIHQPLHVGGGDAGGNFVKVSFMGSHDTNLHTVWDTDLINGESMGYADYARFLDHAGDGERDAWKRSTVEEWADEAVALRPGLYRFPDTKKPGGKNSDGPAPAEVATLTAWGFVFPISYAYVAANRELLRTQLDKGGIRLAHLLNQIFSR